MAVSFEDFNENEAHIKFKQLNISRFNLEEIDTIFKSKYQAEEVDSVVFPELNNDPFYNASYTTKCYSIQNPSILKDIFNDEEKEFHNEYIKSNGIINRKIDHSNENERRIAVEQGSVLYVIFQSKDGKYLSDFFSTFGPCEKIMNEMIVFKGLEPSKCVLGEMDYKLYLLALVNAGYITL